MKRTLMVVLAVLAMVSFVCAAPAAQEKAEAKGGAVEITFNRPNAVGDSFEIDFHMEFNLNGSYGRGMNSQKENSTIKVDFSGDVRVLKVNEAGEAAMMFCTVREAKINIDGEDRDPDLKGAQLGVTFPESGPKFIRRDGKKVSQDANMLLSYVFEPPNGINADDYMSAKKPVKPGDSWEADSKVLAKVNSTDDITIDPATVKSTITFVGTEKWNEVDCYHVTQVTEMQRDAREPATGKVLIESFDDQYLPVDKKSKVFHVKGTQKTTYSGQMVSKKSPPLPVKQKTTATYEVSTK